MDRTGGRAIIAIDLLRFACAMLVVWRHFGFTDWIEPSASAGALLAGIAPPGIGGPLARVGWLGVELFFVISGLVIAQSAVGVGPATFIRRRVLRLVPAAWICASLTFVLLVASGIAASSLALPWLRSMTFWPVGMQIDGSYWTLGIEASFYLVVAALARGDARRVERAGIVIGAISVAFWIAALVFGPTVSVLAGDRYTMLTLLPHGCLFAVGMTVAAMRDRVTGARLARLSLWSIAALVEIAHAAEREAHGVAALSMLASTLFIAGLALLLAADRLQPLLARFIRPERARTIGLMTYPLYLLHQDAGAALMAGLVRAGVPVWLAMILAVAAVLLLAWLVATRFEPVLRGVLARLLSPGRGPAPDTRPTASLPTG